MFLEPTYYGLGSLFLDIVYTRGDRGSMEYFFFKVCTVALYFTMGTITINGFCDTIDAVFQNGKPIMP
jgi:hypothetical protein